MRERAYLLRQEKFQEVLKKIKPNPKEGRDDWDIDQVSFNDCPIVPVIPPYPEDVNIYTIRNHPGAIGRYMYEAQRDTGHVSTLRVTSLRTSCDVQIVCDGGYIFCHRAVLYLSPLLRQYIRENMGIIGIPHRRNMITIHFPEEKMEIMELALRVFYTGFCLCKNVQQVGDVQILLQFLQFPLTRDSRERPLTKKEKFQRRQLKVFVPDSDDESDDAASEKSNVEVEVNPFDDNDGFGRQVRGDKDHLAEKTREWVELLNDESRKRHVVIEPVMSPPSKVSRTRSSSFSDNMQSEVNKGKGKDNEKRKGPAPLTAKDVGEALGNLKTVPLPRSSGGSGSAISNVSSKSTAGNKQQAKRGAPSTRPLPSLKRQRITVSTSSSEDIEVDPISPPVLSIAVGGKERPRGRYEADDDYLHHPSEETDDYSTGSQSKSSQDSDEQLSLADRVKNRRRKQNAIRKDTDRPVVGRKYPKRKRTPRKFPIEEIIIEDDNDANKPKPKHGCFYCEKEFAREHLLDRHFSEDCGIFLQSSYTYPEKKCLHCDKIFDGLRHYDFIGHIHECNLVNSKPGSDKKGPGDSDVGSPDQHKKNKDDKETKSSHMNEEEIVVDDVSSDSGEPKSAEDIILEAFHDAEHVAVGETQVVLLRTDDDMISAISERRVKVEEDYEMEKPKCYDYVVKELKEAQAEQAEINGDGEGKEQQEEEENSNEQSESLGASLQQPEETLKESENIETSDHEETLKETGTIETSNTPGIVQQNETDNASGTQKNQAEAIPDNEKVVHTTITPPQESPSTSQQGRHYAMSLGGLRGSQSPRHPPISRRDEDWQPPAGSSKVNLCNLKVLKDKYIDSCSCKKGKHSNVTQAMKCLAARGLKKCCICGLQFPSKQIQNHCVTHFHGMNPGHVPCQICRDTFEYSRIEAHVIGEHLTEPSEVEVNENVNSNDENNTESPETETGSVVEPANIRRGKGTSRKRTRGRTPSGPKLSLGSPKQKRNVGRPRKNQNSVSQKEKPVPGKRRGRKKTGSKTTVIETTQAQGTNARFTSDEELFVPVIRPSACPPITDTEGRDSPIPPLIIRVRSMASLREPGWDEEEDEREKENENKEDESGILSEEMVEEAVLSPLSVGMDKMAQITERRKSGEETESRQPAPPTVTPPQGSPNILSPPIRTPEGGVNAVPEITTPPPSIPPVHYVLLNNSGPALPDSAIAAIASDIVSNYRPGDILIPMNRARQNPQGQTRVVLTNPAQGQMGPPVPPGQPQMRPSSPTGQPQMRPSSPTGQPQLRYAIPTGQPQVRLPSPPVVGQLQVRAPVGQPQIRSPPLMPPGVGQMQVRFPVPSATQAQMQPSVTAYGQQIRPQGYPVPSATQAQMRPSVPAHGQQIRPQGYPVPSATQAQMQPSVTAYGQQIRPQGYPVPSATQAQMRPSVPAHGQQIRPQGYPVPSATQAQMRPSVPAHGQQIRPQYLPVPSATQAQMRPSVPAHGQQFRPQGHPTQEQMRPSVYAHGQQFRPQGHPVPSATQEQMRPSVPAHGQQIRPQGHPVPSTTQAQMRPSVPAHGQQIRPQGHPTKEQMRPSVFAHGQQIRPQYLPVRSATQAQMRPSVPTYGQQIRPQDLPVSGSVLQMSVVPASASNGQRPPTQGQSSPGVVASPKIECVRCHRTFVTTELYEIHFC